MVPKPYGRSNPWCQNPWPGYARRQRKEPSAKLRIPTARPVDPSHLGRGRPAPRGKGASWKGRGCPRPTGTQPPRTRAPHNPAAWPAKAPHNDSQHRPTGICALRLLPPVLLAPTCTRTPRDTAKRKSAEKGLGVQCTSGHGNTRRRKKQATGPGIQYRPPQGGVPPPPPPASPVAPDNSLEPRTPPAATDGAGPLSAPGGPRRTCGVARHAIRSDNPTRQSAEADHPCAPPSPGPCRRQPTR